MIIVMMILTRTNMLSSNMSAFSLFWETLVKVKVMRKALSMKLDRPAFRLKNNDNDLGFWKLAATRMFSGRIPWLRGTRYIPQQFLSESADDRIVWQKIMPLSFLLVLTGNRSRWEVPLSYCKSQFVRLCSPDILNIANLRDKKRTAETVHQEL